jgi:tetratricopeptide (TPR) repeat protein
VLALFLLLSNQAPKAANGGDAIVTDSQYEAARVQMEGLSLDRIRRFDAGVPLSSDDFVKLRQASDIIDRMMAFAPLQSGLQFLSGKIHHALGEEDLAEDRFHQCVLIVPNDARLHPAKDNEIREEGAECGYQYSQLLLLKRRTQAAFDAADDAVKVVPRNPEYLTARASALNEMRRTAEAKADLNKALKIDPSNTRAKGLLHLIEHG